MTPPSGETAVNASTPSPTEEVQRAKTRLPLATAATSSGVPPGMKSEVLPIRSKMAFPVLLEAMAKTVLFHWEPLSLERAKRIAWSVSEARIPRSGREALPEGSAIRAELRKLPEVT